MKKMSVNSGAGQMGMDIPQFACYFILKAESGGIPVGRIGAFVAFSALCSLGAAMSIPI